MGFDWVIRNDRDCYHVKWKVNLTPRQSMHYCDKKSNLIKLHSSLSRRGAHRKIFTFNTHHICIKLHQSKSISLHLKDSYDLWTVSYSVLYRTSTWSPAVHKDDFCSATDIPTVLNHRRSNRFPAVGNAFNPLTDAYPSKNE